MACTWSSVWKLDDKRIWLNRDQGTLTIYLLPGLPTNFELVYGDPRKMAEALHEIADALLQCEHIIGYNADDSPVYCNKPGTVRSEFSLCDGGFRTARTFCDEHFTPEPEAIGPQEPQGDVKF